MINYYSRVTNWSIYCIRSKACDFSKNARSALLFFKVLKMAKFLCPQLGYDKTVKNLTNQVLRKVWSIFIARYLTSSIFQKRNVFKKVRFSDSSSNTFLTYNNKGMQFMRKQVAVEYSLIQECSPYLSLW